MELETLIKQLNKVYSKETCYPKCRKDWTPQNNTLGHCSIASLIVMDYFKGKIYKTKVDGISHYFNIVDNKIIDLTSSQFQKKIDYSIKEEKERNELLKDKDTKERYLLLKKKLEESLKIEKEKR